MTVERIGILTGGGDCPGLNAVIRAVAKKAMIDHGMEVIGILDGFEGAVLGKYKLLSYENVSNILSLGGTILGTSNKANPFEFIHEGKEPTDESKNLIKHFEKSGLDALICIGGDGTMAIANRIQKLWPKVIGIPKTIDNDLKATDQTFGFDTACNFVTESLDRIHSTAQSHHRVMVIEVMGRYAGWIALEGGIAGGGDIILIPELPFSFDEVIAEVKKRSKKGKRFSIIVVAEGAHPEGGDITVNKVVKDSPDPIRLGGIGKIVTDYVQEKTGHESRVTVLGHLQRGGPPSFFDRILATRYGIAAINLVEKKVFGKMVALNGSKITAVPLSEATSGLKLVSPDHELIKAARSVGTSFGVKGLS